MRAAVLMAHGSPLELQDLPDPQAESAGAVVQTLAVGLCRTDLHQWRGDWDWLGFKSALPRVLGHEMAGRVVEVGPEVRKIRVGDRVTVPFHLACGGCERCRGGQSNVCPYARYLGASVPGAFAEFVAVPNADVNCVRLPDGVGDDAGSALGCRLMTAWHGLVGLARLRPAEWVVVVGAGGGVGLSAVLLVSALGARAIAVDLGAAKLDAARRAGAELAVDAAEVDVAAAVRELTSGGADVALDAVGKSATIRSSIASLRAGGRHVQIGMTGTEDRGEISVPIDAIVASELTLYGVSGNPHDHYRELLDLVASGRCDPAGLVHRRIRLDSINEALIELRDYRSTGLTVITELAGAR